MKRRITTLSLGFLLALLLGVAVAVPLLLDAREPISSGAEAPDNAPVAPGIALEGIVHYVSGGSPSLWVIDTYPITVVSSTHIISHGLPARPGVWARVEAIKSAGLQAMTLELQDVPTSDFYDRITAIDESLGQWRVGQTLVRHGPDTVVTGVEPREGHLALVHGTRSMDGIDAHRILVVAADAEVVYQGTLTMMGATAWQVDDVLVELTATTVFSGSTPAIGSRVQARGTETGLRRLRAAHVWTLDDADPQIRFTGWLQRIDGQAFPYVWRVNLIDGPQLRQVFVAVYEDTLVDETAGPAAPGAWLSGELVYQGNAFYQAARVAVLPRAPKRQIVEQIRAMPADTSWGIWQVGQYRVEVGQETGIIGSPQVGDMVWVSGTPDYANILQAQVIEVLGE